MISRPGHFSANQVYYWLLMPAVLVVVALYLYPVAHAIYYSFCRLDFLRPARNGFIGLGNYQELIGDRDFLKVISNSVFFTLVTVGVEIVLGLCCALLLHQDFRGRKIIRTIWLMPIMFAPVLVAYQWKWLFNDQYGLVNYGLMILGIMAKPKAWLTDAHLSMIAIMVADIWFWTPFAVILTVAGLESLPSECFEAARVDGAGAGQRFFFITLPLLAPVLVMVALLRSIEAFQIFDIVYILTYGGPGLQTEMVSTYAYKVAFRHFDMGMASAISVIALFVMIGMAMAILKGVRTKG